jgi:hypothetical protein
LGGIFRLYRQTVLKYFPVRLYCEQWNRLLGAAEQIRKFMEENKSKLKPKEQNA